MKMKKPIIKFNGGKPVSLCNRCFVIMCYVKCTDDDNCVVIEIRGNGNGKEKYISTPIGEQPPSYCDRCKKLLSYTLNE